MELLYIGFIVIALGIGLVGISAKKNPVPYELPLLGKIGFILFVLGIIVSFVAAIIMNM